MYSLFRSTSLCLALTLTLVSSAYATDISDGAPTPAADAIISDTPVAPPPPEEPIQPQIIWQEASTWEELITCAQQATHIRLTADLVLSSEAEYTASLLADQVLDMGNHSILVKAGGSLYLGAHPIYDLTIVGDGEEQGLFRLEPGAIFYAGGVDFSQVAGRVAHQPEGSRLTVFGCVTLPGQFVFAQQPVLSSAVFDNPPAFVAPAGLSPEELEAILPPFYMTVNYQGNDEFYHEEDPVIAHCINWDAASKAEDIALNRRITLSAQPVAPLSGSGYPDDQIPLLLKPVFRDVGFLVDDAAFGDVSTRLFPNGSLLYDLEVYYPETVLLDDGRLCTPTIRELELSFDHGESWVGSLSGLVPEGVEVYDNDDQIQLWDDAGRSEVLCTLRMEYQGAGCTYILYTDTLVLTPQGAVEYDRVDGSRGGTVVLYEVERPQPPDTSPPEGDGGTDDQTPCLPPSGADRGNSFDDQASVPLTTLDSFPVPEHCASAQPGISPQAAAAALPESQNPYSPQQPAVDAVSPDPAAAIVPESFQSQITTPAASSVGTAPLPERQPVSPQIQPEGMPQLSPTDDQPAPNASIVPLQVAVGFFITAAVLTGAILFKPHALLAQLRWIFSKK